MDAPAASPELAWAAPRQVPTHYRRRGSRARRAGARVAGGLAEVRSRRASAPVAAHEPSLAADEAARRRRVAAAADRIRAAHGADASAALGRRAATGSASARRHGDSGGRRRQGRGDGRGRVRGAGAGEGEEREEPSKRVFHVELQGGPGQPAVGPGAYTCALRVRSAAPRGDALGHERLRLVPVIGSIRTRIAIALVAQTGFPISPIQGPWFPGSRRSRRVFAASNVSSSTCG